MPVCRVPDDPDLHLAGFVTGCDHSGHLPHPRLCQPHPPLLPQPGEHGAYTETSIPAGCQVLNSQYKIKIFRTENNVNVFLRGWDWCEGEEALWAPILLRTFSLCLSLLLVMVSALTRQYKAGVTLSLVCVYLKYRDLNINSLDKLRRLESTVTR